MVSKVFIELIVFLLNIMCVASVLIIRFENADMTEVRLFIDFFDKWLMLSLLVIMGTIARKQWGIRS